ncbi:MAG: hypothetical protein ABR860_08940 [Terracidiphilus sp.]|jgi:hypothetical protein
MRVSRFVSPESASLQRDAPPHEATPNLLRKAMTDERTHNPMLWSTIAIALLVAVTAVAGIFWPATYAKETLYSSAGAIGSDVVDLFLVVPLLLISGIIGYRGSVPARLVWLGTLGYLLYNFVLYAFGTHFKALSLVYWATLSLCFYATVFCLPLISLEQIAQTYSPRAPRKTIVILLLAIAVLFAAFDLDEDIPALLAGRVPASVILVNLPVSFIHCLDLIFLLPGMCITSYLLFRRKASGYALAPAFLALLAIMNIELSVLMAVMALKGCFGMFYPMIISFAVVGVAAAILLWFYFSLARKAAGAVAA